MGEFEVLGLPVRRGPAAEALTHYLETAASAERRLKLRSSSGSRTSRGRARTTRPDKRERRQLLKLHRGQN